MEPTRYATMDIGSELHKQFKLMENGGSNWEAAIVEIAEMLGIRPIEHYITRTDKLYIVSSTYYSNKLKLESLFRYDKKTEYYTLRLDTREGKDIHKKYREIVKKHNLESTLEIGDVLKKLWEEHAFYNKEESILLVKWEEQYYLRWQGEEAPPSDLKMVNNPPLEKLIDESIELASRL